MEGRGKGLGRDSHYGKHMRRLLLSLAEPMKRLSLFNRIVELSPLSKPFNLLAWRAFYASAALRTPNTLPHFGGSGGAKFVAAAKIHCGTSFT